MHHDLACGRLLLKGTSAFTAFFTSDNLVAPSDWNHSTCIQRQQNRNSDFGPFARFPVPRIDCNVIRYPYL